MEEGSSRDLDAGRQTWALLGYYFDPRLSPLAPGVNTITVLSIVVTKSSKPNTVLVVMTCKMGLEISSYLFWEVWWHLGRWECLGDGHGTDVCGGSCNTTHLDTCAIIHAGNKCARQAIDQFCK